MARKSRTLKKVCAHLRRKDGTMVDLAVNRLRREGLFWIYEAKCPFSQANDVAWVCIDGKVDFEIEAPTACIEPDCACDSGSFQFRVLI